jgi:serine protease
LQKTRSDPKFESLAFRVEARGEQPLQVARRVVRRALPGQGWRVVPLDARKGEFEALPRRGRRLTTAAAWTSAYRLRDQPEVVYAEPLFEVPATEQYVPPRRARASSVGSEDDPRTEADYEWSLKKMFVRNAWDLFGTARPGRGVRVGHPDTGYTQHPEIFGSRLLTNLGADFEDDDRDATDTLASGFLANPGHGTGTASVIMSGAGAPDGAATEPFVSGVAPFTSLVPIRTTSSVVLWSMRNLVRAIRYAVDNGCHVISISLGGPAASHALHSAVQDAENAGVIVLCAAGNQVYFVVFPAAFDEVIAVAASTIGDEPWPGSCRGPAVDVTAPGASVWRAEVVRASGSIQNTVKRGNGTSFAVAGTAGLAALWLSFHGRSTLIQKYGKDRLASVFKQLLQSTCRKPSGWDTGSFGAGIVHARRLLEAPLPEFPKAGGLRATARRPVSIDDDVFERIVHVLAPASRSGVSQALADFLRVSEAELPAVLHDVGDELAFNIGADPALRDRLMRASTARSGAARGIRARSARTELTAARRRLLNRGSGKLKGMMKG